MVRSGVTHVVHSARRLAGAGTCKVTELTHLGPQVGCLGCFEPN